METQNKKYQIKPFVKWAGGKRQILDKILKYIEDSLISEYGPNDYKGADFTYIEPFVGGGAVFFSLQPKKAVINDLNEELINAYRIIKSPNYLELIDELNKHKNRYSDEQIRDDYFYEVRHWDREDNWPDCKSDIERAGRMIFINKTCYNGLYRVNSKGQFNTPVGRYKNPMICDETNIKNIHEYFSENKNIKIMSGSYKNAIKLAKAGDIVYLDPPYDYEDDDGFTKYQMQGFTFEDFKELKNCCDEALDRGAYVILSNNATDKVLKLFGEDVKYKVFYEPDCFSSLRCISCDGKNRKSGYEAIIWGTPNGIPLPQANDFEKVIKLMKCDNSKLKDFPYLREYIKVESNRQISYYKSAMCFLGLINNKHEFTSVGENLKNMAEKDMRKAIALRITENKVFQDIYVIYKKNKGSIEQDLVINELKKYYKNLSEVTIKRRYSTIIKWLDWAYNELAV